MAFPLRKNEDDEKMDGERLEGEVVLLDKDFRDKLEMEEHVSVPKRAYISREDRETFGLTQDALGACQYSKESGGCSKTSERISGQGSRESKDTNGVESGRNTDGYIHQELEQQRQSGTSIKFKRQQRRSKKDQRHRG